MDIGMMKTVTKKVERGDTEFQIHALYGFQI